MAERVYGLPPVFAADARVLVLGSMPGVQSLALQEYYAHPRNAFWPIVARCCGFAPDLPYAARLPQVVAAKIALWDVVGSCIRTGSLDAAIEADSVQANPLAELWAACPGLATVLCNGATAHRLFVAGRFGEPLGVAPGGGRWRLAAGREVHVERLPSTSPAHAGMSRDAKFAVWQQALLRAGAAILPAARTPADRGRTAP